MKKLMSTFVVVAIMLSGCSKALKIDIKPNIEAEYGEKLDNSKLFDEKKSDKGVVVKEIKNFDNKKIGGQKVKVVFTLNDKTKEKSVTINVKDTKAPEILLDKETIEITAGEELDPTKNIKSVKDPVDGDIPFIKEAPETNKKASEDFNKLKKEDVKEDTKVAGKALNDFLIEDNKDLYLNNCYYIESNIDTNKAGEYVVKVVAIDKNGNKTVKEFKVIVKEKPADATIPEVPDKQQTQTPASNGSNNNTNQQQQPSSNNNSGATNNGGQTTAPNQQQPSTPPPSQPATPPQQPVGCTPDGTYGRLGNSGRVFFSEQAADQWAQDQWMDENSPYYLMGYHAWTVTDSCGEERNDIWTIDWYETRQ